MRISQMLNGVAALALASAMDPTAGQPGSPVVPNSPDEGGSEPNTETDPGTPPATEPVKNRRKPSAKKATAKADKKTKKAAARKEPKEPTFDLTKLRKLLKKAEVKFNARSGVDKLVALAEEHGVDIGSAQRDGGSIVPVAFKQKYGAKGHCGDEIAEAFAALKDKETGSISEEVLREVAEANGVDFGKWSHVNLGQKRMNLSNVLRGKLGKGEKVVIGKHKMKIAA